MSDSLSVDFSSGDDALSAAFSGSPEAAKSLLGIYGKFASLSSIQRRYFLLSAARSLSDRKLLQECRHKPIPKKTEVLMLRSKEHGKLFYGNLIICGGVWDCPICAVVISERRRQELTAALAATDFHQVLVTFTLRHKLTDSLKVVLGALLAAFRDFQSGNGWRGFRAAYSFVGSIRGLEVTHGAAAGWHPHTHFLMLFEKPFTSAQYRRFCRDMKKRWLMVLKRQGFDATWANGLDVTSEGQKLAEYVAKFGRDPIVFDDGSKWTIEHELTKSGVKLGRFGGRTPMQILVDFALLDDKQAAALWSEFAREFKGRHQLQWSKGLRVLLGLGLEKSDEEEATEDIDHADKFHAFTLEQWQRVLRHRLRPVLLDLGEFAGASAVESVLSVLEASPQSLQAVLSGFYSLYGREYVSMEGVANASSKVS